ncbi:MAG: peptidoglycan DD-metalloendopeptidase family protein [bacterium]|nr:peptidoglycan DD-metalloendopeptidase family protein [bacterium]
MFLILVFSILVGLQPYILKPGDNIAGVLISKKVSNELVAKIVSALGKETNLKRCKPGDKLYITMRDNKFIELRYEQPKATWIIDSLFQVSRLQPRKVLIYLKGTIETGSLWDALLKVGGTPQLVYEFAEGVFTWDIDFNTDTRNGDTFEIFTTQEFIGDRFVGYGKILLARYILGNKEFTGVYYPKVRPGYYDLNGKALQKLFLKSPISYVRISSKFSYSRFHPILRIFRPHLGVDYAAPTGTPVRSIGSGKVTFAGWRGGFGRQVIVRHTGGFESYYGHLSRFGKGIKNGVSISQGQIIGYVGSTGLSTGPHLDFKLKKHGTWINPLKLNPPSIKPLKGKELEDYEKYKNEVFTLIAGIESIRKLSILPIFK